MSTQVSERCRYCRKIGRIGNRDSYLCLGYSKTLKPNFLDVYKLCIRKKDGFTFILSLSPYELMQLGKFIKSEFPTSL
jgi:hypothetical protein